MTMRALIAATACCVAAVAAPFRFASMFGDSMVLQRDVAANVWGWASPNMPIYGSLVNTATNTTVAIQTTADATGQWTLSLPPQPGSPSLYTLGVSSEPVGHSCDTYGFNCNGISTTLTGIMFGDVVFCSGQSNMQVPVSFAFNASAELQAASNYSSIVSILQVQWSTASKTVALDDLVKLQLPWQPATNVSLFNFSATCWYTGLALLQGRRGADEQIPLGLIASTWPGTAIKPWTPPEVNSKCMPLYPWTASTGPKDCGMMHWPCNTSALWNSMIAPFTQGPMQVSSFVWYQGENDAAKEEYEFYACQLSGMISSWRAAFGSPNAHWVTVQLAPYLASTSNEQADTLAGFRDMQCQTTWAQPNASCAVIDDGGDPTSPMGSIHSRNKQLTGRRIAAPLLQALYGQQAQPWQLSGPRYASARGTYSGGILYIYISFDPSTVGPNGTGLTYIPSHTSVYQNASRCPLELPGMSIAQCGGFTITDNYGNVYNASVSLLPGSQYPGYGDRLMLQADSRVHLSIPVSTSWGWANWPIVQWYGSGAYVDASGVVQGGLPLHPWNRTLDNML